MSNANRTGGPAHRRPGAPAAGAQHYSLYNSPFALLRSTLAINTSYSAEK